MESKKAAVTMAIGLMGMASMACGGEKNEESSAVAGSEGSISFGSMAVDATKVKIVSAGRLTVATNAEFPLYEYRKSNSIKGIDVGICQAAVERLGLKLEIEDVALDTITPEVTPSKASLVAAGITVAEDRKQNTDFSDTYISTKQLILMRDDSTLADRDDLKGRKAGVQQNTASDLMSMGDFGDDVVVRFPKSVETVQAFTQGKIDAVIVDSRAAEQFVKGMPGTKVLDVNYLDEFYVVGMKEGSTELLNAVNGVSSELKSEGRLDEVVTQYTKTG